MSAISKSSRLSHPRPKVYPKSAIIRKVPNHSLQDCGHRVNNKSIHGKTSAFDGKNVIQVVTQEQIRDLLIPGIEPNEHPTIWPKSELERILSKAKIKSFQDQLEEMNRVQVEKQSIKEQSEKRKAALREYDEAKASKDIVMESNDKDDEENLQLKILDRAFLAKQEQEEEVKKANRLILATKCHVIRDAQIAEKYELLREIKDEELKLEKMMLSKAEEALKKEDLRREKIKKEHFKHSKEILKQLEAKEFLRLKEAERIEEESKKLKYAVSALKNDDDHKKKIEFDRKKKIQADLQQAKELSSYFKQLEFEEQRRAELKIAEYMRQKREREAQKAEEARIAKEAKDRDHEKLLQIQQKLIDTKSEREAIVLRRGQEQVEREYRRKEREAAIKKKEIEREIAKARAIQLEETKRQRALEIAKDEMDFKVTVEKLKCDEKKLKQKELIKMEEKKLYRQEIMRQMNERERKRKEEDADAKKAFQASIDAEKNREKLVKNVIAMKIKQMKETNIPERFVKDVEKQLGVPTSSLKNEML